MVSSTVFWGATIAYLGITLFLAYLAYKKTKMGEEFLLAGRNVPSWIIGLSYGSTFISTSAIVGFGGVAGVYGMSIIWLTVLCIGVGIMIAFILYGQRIRTIGQSLKALTFPDFIGKRFQSPFLQYSSALIIVLAMPLYAAAVLIGGARFIETTLGLDYDTALLGFAIITAAYVIFGGLLAVLYTDAFQGGIMMFGLTAILVLTFYILGGVNEANQALTDLATDPGVPSSLTAQGMTGWTSFPELLSQNWWFMVTTIIMGVGIGVLAQPQLTVRFMTAKNRKSLNRAVPVGALFIFLSTMVAFTVGALSNVYFWDEEGKLSIQVAGNVDKVIPMYIDSAMPDTIIVLFMLTLLAAAMSTLSALFHTMGSAAGHDLWCYISPSRLMPKSMRKDVITCSLKANRIGTFIMIAASIAVAYSMPQDIIAIATAMFMGLCAVALLPMLTYGIFTKKPFSLPAKLSLVIGASAWFLWAMFVYERYAKVFGLCEFLFGEVTLLQDPYKWIDPLFIGIPLSVAALIIGILIVRQSRPATTASS